MIPTAVLIGWLASIVLAVYVGRHAVRETVRKKIKSMAVPCPEAWPNPEWGYGWNSALNQLEGELTSREWRSPMTKRGKI